MTTTDLVITGLHMPPYATRGVKQSIEPIDGSKQIRRTINGALVNLSNDQFRKYKTAINCEDQQPPGNIWPGTEITIACIVEFCYLTSGGTPDRPEVSGSSRIEGNFTFYRPIITALVTGININRDEWGAVVGWQLEAEEV